MAIATRLPTRSDTNYSHKAGKQSMNIETKQLSAQGIEFKQASEGSTSPGRMRFYFSTWDNYDRVGERPVRGAFKKYLPQLIKSGFSSVNHGHDGLPVATIEDAGEDNVGAWAEIEYHSHQDAQDAYTVAKERAARGKDVNISMAYKVHADREADMDDADLKADGYTKGRELVECEVIEEIGRAS